MSLHPVFAEALAPFIATPFEDWGFLNGISADVYKAFKAEEARHDKAMQDGIGDHAVSQRCEGHADYYECSCGFKWKVDYSG